MSGAFLAVTTGGLLWHPEVETSDAAQPPLKYRTALWQRITWSLMSAVPGERTPV